MLHPQLLVRSRNGAELHTERGKILDFTGGDLFSIASHPHVRAAAHSAMERFGVSSISAAERGGYTEIHNAAEQAICRRLVAERAVLFPSRTQAILSIFSAGINVRGGPVYVDGSVSSPVIDACHLAELSTVAVDLRLATGGGWSTNQPGLIVLEGVSRNGFHLPNVPKLLEKIKVPIIADESFAFGISGLIGLGNFPPPVLNNLPLLRVVGFEGSLGVPSCAVVGNATVIEELVRASRQRATEVGTSPSEAAAIVAGLELVEQMGPRRDELGIRCAGFIASLTELGISLGSDLPLPYISIQLPSSKIAKEFSAGLLSRGYLVDFIGCLVPLSSVCSVRVVLSLGHSQTHIDGLVRAIQEVCKRVLPSNSQ